MKKPDPPSLQPEKKQELISSIRESARQLEMGEGFQKTCNRLLFSAKQSLADKLQLHRGPLLQTELNELIQITLMKKAAKILPEYFEEPDHKDAFEEALKKQKGWKIGATGFEQFLTEKGIYILGHTFLQPYINQHDYLQNEYRKSHPEAATQEELEKFDQTTQLQLLATFFAAPALQAFAELAPKPQTNIDTKEASIEARESNINSLNPAAITSLIASLEKEQKPSPLTAAEKLQNNYLDPIIAMLKLYSEHKRSMTIEEYKNEMDSAENIQKKWLKARAAINPGKEIGALYKALGDIGEKAAQIASDHFMRKDKSYPAINDSTYLTGRPLDNFIKKIEALQKPVPPEEKTSLDSLWNECLTELCIALKESTVLSQAKYDASCKQIKERKTVALSKKSDTNAEERKAKLDTVINALTKADKYASFYFEKIEKAEMSPRGRN